MEGNDVALVAGNDSEVEGSHGQAFRAETASHAKTSREVVPSPPHCVGPQVGAPWRHVVETDWCAAAFCLSMMHMRPPERAGVILAPSRVRVIVPPPCCASETSTRAIGVKLPTARKPASELGFDDFERIKITV